MPEIAIDGRLGVNLSLTSLTAEHALGEVVRLSKGGEAIYCKASAAITGEGYVCIVDPAFAAAMITTTNATGKRGAIVGVAPAAVAANEFFWLATKGKALTRCAASCAANAQLNTTATAGVLDDDGTAGAVVVENLVITTAVGAGAAANAPGHAANVPRLGAAI